jgi:hypothetical protein
VRHLIDQPCRTHYVGDTWFWQPEVAGKLDVLEPRRYDNVHLHGTHEDGEVRLRVPSPGVGILSGFLGSGKDGEEMDLGKEYTEAMGRTECSMCTGCAGGCLRSQIERRRGGALL